MFIESENSYDVFFCYARKDYHITKKIKKVLTGVGYTSFIDAECLLPGDNFWEKIQEQLFKCKAFVCVVSGNAIDSEWFIKEVSYAVSIGKFVIPIKVDNTPVSGKLAQLIGKLQFIYWDDSSAIISRKHLVESLNHYVNRLEKNSNVGIRTDAEIANEIQFLDNYTPKRVHYDIFISYRKVGGRDTARSIKQQLQLLGYENIFFDYNSIRDGYFNTQILDAIYSCKDFLLLLTPESMERCGNSGDWVAREIKTALKYNCKITPIAVQSNFSWPQNFPNDLSRIKNIQQHLLLVNEYFEDSIERLSKRLETSRGNTENKIAEQTFYYKIATSIKCKIYIDDKECVIINKDEFKRIPLQKGEYIVRIVRYDDNHEIQRKIVCMDSDKVEML